MKTKDEDDIFSTQIEMLARMNEDARDGYAAAADLTRDVPLSKRLLKGSDERKDFAATLRRSSAPGGTNVAPRGSYAASAHRAWMGLRHFASGSDDAVLEECLRGETTAIASYEHVLAQSDWSTRATLRARVASQLGRIRANAKDLESELMTRIGTVGRAATIRRATVLVQSRHTLTLATVGEAGPWASSLSYVNDGFTFFFVSDPNSRHAANIGLDARVAATINDDFAAWIDIRGVQIEGRAELVSDLSTRADVLAKIFSRFPYLHAIESEAKDVAAVSSCALFKISPSHVWLVDHERGMHARFEIDLQPSTHP